MLTVDGCWDQTIQRRMMCSMKTLTVPALVVFVYFVLLQCEMMNGLPHLSIHHAWYSVLSSYICSSSMFHADLKFNFPVTLDSRDNRRNSKYFNRLFHYRALRDTIVSRKKYLSVLCAHKQFKRHLCSFIWSAASRKLSTQFDDCRSNEIWTAVTLVVRIWFHYCYGFWGSWLIRSV